MNSNSFLAYIPLIEHGTYSNLFTSCKNVRHTPNFFTNIVKPVRQTLNETIPIFASSQDTHSDNILNNNIFYSDFKTTDANIKHLYFANPYVNSDKRLPL